MPARQRRAVRAVMEAEAAARVEADTFDEGEGASIVALPGAAAPRGEDAPLEAAAPDGVDAGHWRAIRTAAPWLQASDGLVVRMLCDAIVEYGQARAAVAEQGTMVLTSTGSMIPNPWHRVLAERRAEIVKIARDLGLTPAARAALVRW